MSPLRALTAIVVLLVGGLVGFALGRASVDEGPERTPPEASPTTSITSPTPTGTSPAGPCGTELKSTGGSWVCTFADEFAGTTLDRTKWQPLTTARSGYTNGGECFVDSPDNISVSDGVLRLTLRRESALVSCPGLPGPQTTLFTSGMVTTSGRFAQAYGRFEVRARFPTATVAGLHAAIWLWPQDQAHYGPRPASGEIDIAEYFTAYPDRVIPYLHFNEAFAGQRVTNNECLVQSPGDFHTYALEWTPDTVIMRYDDDVCLTATWRARGLVPPAPFDMPFFVNLTQALGKGRNAPVAATPLPATMEVDYVRVWS